MNLANNKTYQELVAATLQMSEADKIDVLNQAINLKDSSHGLYKLFYANFVYDIKPRTEVEQGGVESAVECIKMLLADGDHLETALTDVKEEYAYLSLAEWTQVEQHFGV